MSSKKHNDFVSKSILVHGYEYIYDKSIYINHREKLTITCRKHGDFLISPRTHLNGGKCELCKKGTTKMYKLRKTQQQFENDANKYHDNKYDYSKAIYETNESLLTIICPIHGEFKQIARVHLRRGCKACGGEKRRLTTSLFISKAMDIHGNRYNYDDVNYIKKKDKVKIKCSDHGYFMQSPSDHLSGSGCPFCANTLTSWSRSDYISLCKKYNGKTNIYLIKMYSKNECFYKIGLTVHSVKKRYAKDKFYSIKELSVINIESDAGWDMEKKLLKSVSKLKYIPFFKIQGYTECFYKINDDVMHFFGVSEDA